jgi:hypothetical protein
VHDRGALLDRQPVGQHRVHLVDKRDRTVDADFLGLFLRLAELPVPAPQLPFDVAIAACEIAQADRVHVDPVDGGKHVDELLSRHPPPRFVEHRLGACDIAQHVSVHELHQVERPIVHRLVRAERQSRGDRHVGIPQR